MAYYLISYDLHKVRNYEPLYELLKSWKAARILESVWLAELTGPAETIRDFLRAHADADDGFFVIQIFAGSQWATWRVQVPGFEWLQKHIP